MIIQGDCIEVLKTLEPESVDAIVTDPPYGLSDHKPGEVEKCLAAWLKGEPYSPKGHGFMGKDWDAWVPGPEAWREVYRVMKPGAFIACFASTRTADLMSMALRLAGFRKHTDLFWAFGSGFPKATSLSKNIDRQAGAVRDVVGVGMGARNGNGHNNDYGAFCSAEDGTYSITAPATQAAKEWDGYAYGLQALKPAVEPVLLFQKPYEGKAVESILKHGCGALNIDGSRIGTDEETRRAKGGWQDKGYVGGEYDSEKYNAFNARDNQGRWPANLILQKDCPEVMACFPETKNGGQGSHTKAPNSAIWNAGTCGFKGEKVRTYVGDQGSAARFFKQCEITDEDRRIFYTAKPSKAERNAGCHRIGGNGHPTVKPLALMKYLIGLISRPGHTVLDPFMGSGTTGVACLNTNRNFIGIEKDAKYFEISQNRINEALKKTG